MNVIKTVDLITINEAAKALKQKTFMLINNCLYGLDSPSYLVYTDQINLQANYSWASNMIINTKELSAFIKLITVEDEFEIKYIDNTTAKISTITGNELSIYFDAIICNNIINKRMNMSQLQFTSIIDITSDLEQLFAMKKVDGIYKYIKNINNINYFMILFPGILPVNKSDKVLLSINDTGSNQFISNFIVNKKKINIYIYLAYLKV